MGKRKRRNWTALFMAFLIAFAVLNPGVIRTAKADDAITLADAIEQERFEMELGEHSYAVSFNTDMIDVNIPQGDGDYYQSTGYLYYITIPAGKAALIDMTGQNEGFAQMLVCDDPNYPFNFRYISTIYEPVRIIPNNEDEDVRFYAFFTGDTDVYFHFNITMEDNDYYSYDQYLDEAVMLQEGDNALENQDNPYLYYDEYGMRYYSITGTIYQIDVPAGMLAGLHLDYHGQGGSSLMLMGQDGIEWMNDGDFHSIINSSDETMTFYAIYPAHVDNAVLTLNYAETDGLYLFEQSEKAVEVSAGTLSFDPADTFPAIFKTEDNNEEKSIYGLGSLYKMSIPAGKLLKVSIQPFMDSDQREDGNVFLFEDLSAHPYFGTYGNYDSSSMTFYSGGPIVYLNDSDSDRDVYLWMDGTIAYNVDAELLDIEPLMIRNRTDSATELQIGDNQIEPTMDCDQAILTFKYLWYDEETDTDIEMTSNQLMYGKLYRIDVPIGSSIHASIEPPEEADQYSVDAYFMADGDFEHPWHIYHFKDEDRDDEESKYSFMGGKTYYVWVECDHEFNLHLDLFDPGDYAVENRLDEAKELEEGENTIRYSDVTDYYKHWHEYDSESGEEIICGNLVSGILYKVTIPKGKTAVLSSETPVCGEIYDVLDEEGNPKNDFSDYWGFWDDELDYSFSNLYQHDIVLYVLIEENDDPEEDILKLELVDTSSLALQNTLDEYYTLEEGSNQLNELPTRKVIITSQWYEDDILHTDSWNETGTLLGFTLPAGKTARLEARGEEAVFNYFTSENPYHLDYYWHSVEKMITNTGDDPIMVYLWYQHGSDMEEATAELSYIDADEYLLSRQKDKAIPIEAGQPLTLDHSDYAFDAIYYHYIQELDPETNEWKTGVGPDGGKGVLFAYPVSPNKKAAVHIETEALEHDYDVLIYDDLDDGNDVMIRTNGSISDSSVLYDGDAEMLYFWVLSYGDPDTDDEFTISVTDVTEQVDQVDNLEELQVGKMNRIEAADDIYSFRRNQEGFSTPLIGKMLKLKNIPGESFDLTVPADSAPQISIFMPDDRGYADKVEKHIEFNDESMFITDFRENAEVPQTVDAMRNGEYEATISYIDGYEGDLLVLVMEDGSFGIGKDLADNPFSDVKRYSTSTMAEVYYYESVQFCLENGVMAGNEDGTFAPKGVLTKGQLISMLYRLAGADNTYDSCDFADVNLNSKGKKPFYFDACQWGKEMGIISGTEKGGKLYFGPKDEVTRADCAAMLMQYAKMMGLETEDSIKAMQDDYDLSRYKDEIPGKWRKNALKYAGAKELIVGSVDKNGDLIVGALNSLTRRDAASIFARFMQMYGVGK